MRTHVVEEVPDHGVGFSTVWTQMAQRLGYSRGQCFRVLGRGLSVLFFQVPVEFIHRRKRQETQITNMWGFPVLIGVMRVGRLIAQGHVWMRVLTAMLPVDHFLFEGFSTILTAENPKP